MRAWLCLALAAGGRRSSGADGAWGAASRLSPPLPAAGLLAACRAGSGKDIWGETTLVNYPPGGRRRSSAAAARFWRRPSRRPGGAVPAQLLPAAAYEPPLAPAAGQGRLEVPVQANDDGVQTPIALKCQCSDADPRDQDTQEVGAAAAILRLCCFWGESCSCAGRRRLSLAGAAVQCQRMARRCKAVAGHGGSTAHVRRGCPSRAAGFLHMFLPALLPKVHRVIHVRRRGAAMASKGLLVRPLPLPAACCPGETTSPNAAYLPFPPAQV